MITLLPSQVGSNKESLTLMRDLQQNFAFPTAHLKVFGHSAASVKDDCWTIFSTWIVVAQLTLLTSSIEIRGRCNPWNNDIQMYWSKNELCQWKRNQQVRGFGWHAVKKSCYGRLRKFFQAQFHSFSSSIIYLANRKCI